MSLRSNSPCTSTSRPIFSCQRTARAVWCSQIRLVGGIAERAAGVRGAGVPDVRGLRERADGRGREARQVEALLLHVGALGIGAGAAAHRVIDAGSARRDIGIVDPRRGFARSRRRIGGLEHRLRRRHGRRQARCRARPVPRSSAPRTPASSLPRDRGSSPARDRSARATASTTARSARAPCRGWRRRARADRECWLKSARQILRPSITPSDSTRSSGKLGEVVDLLGRAHEIEMQAGDGQRQRGVAVAARAHRNRSPA